MTAHFKSGAGHRLNATPFGSLVGGEEREQGVKGKSARNLQGRQDSFSGVTIICGKSGTRGVRKVCFTVANVFNALNVDLEA